MIEDTRVGRAWRHVVGPNGDLFEADAISESSWLTYHYGLSNLERYCADRNLIALPAEPETLKAWIKWMMDDEGLSAKTIQTYLAGVYVAHDERGLAINTRALKKVLKAVRERASSTQAAPLMAADLKDILKTMDIKRQADCRDAVACITGLMCGSRQDELTTLDWERPGPPTNGRKGYMREVRGGYEVTLITAKTSKGKPHTFTITNRDAPSLRKWLNAWLAFARIEPGTPLLRSVSRWGPHRPDTPEAAGDLRPDPAPGATPAPRRRHQGHRRLHTGTTVQGSQPARRHGLHDSRSSRPGLENEGEEPPQVRGHPARLRAHRRGPAGQRGEGAQAVSAF
jgi:hypothetical protein